jgi:hypothetical protein
MRSIVASGNGRRPPFGPILGQCGSITASSAPHGTTAAISASNKPRFVRFFFAAKSSDAKSAGSWHPLESMASVWHDRWDVQGFPTTRRVHGSFWRNYSPNYGKDRRPVDAARRLCRQMPKMNNVTPEYRIWVLCHEHRRSTRRCATVLEMKEGPSGSAIRSLIPSHRKLLSSKAMVASVAETPGR